MLAAIIVLSTLAGLFGRPRVGLRSGWGHPGIWLLGVTALCYLNQVLFTVYVLRVHNGDVTFISQYLPDGWFALADHDPALRWLAGHFPVPDLLSVTVLRVQSFLELPLVVLALLTVCRWHGQRAYERVARLVWPIAVSYTTTFCLIELSLHNPYTWDDIVIRTVSAAVVGLLVPRLSGPGDKRVSSVSDLVWFLVSVGAVGGLVLVVYDTALLYNLGHVHAVLPVALLAAVVLLGARLAARRQAGAPAGPGVEMIIRSVGWFLVCFAVPALAIRYGLIFGTPWVAVLAGVLVVNAALDRAGRETIVARRMAWRLQLIGATVTGLAFAFLGYRLTSGYPESRLLVAVAAFCAVTVTVCAVVDRAVVDRVRRESRVA